MPSDDAPFIIESDEELPTGRGKSVGMRLQDTLRGRGLGRGCESSHENATYDMPELYPRHCQTRYQCLGPRVIPEGAVRTDIFFDNSGIVEIYHRNKGGGRDGGGVERGENLGKCASRIRIIGPPLYKHLRLWVAVSRLRSCGNNCGESLINN
jgi:hypothetical protein